MNRFLLITNKFQTLIKQWFFWFPDTHTYTSVGRGGSPSHFWVAIVASTRVDKERKGRTSPSRDSNEPNSFATPSPLCATPLHISFSTDSLIKGMESYEPADYYGAGYKFCVVHVALMDRKDRLAVVFVVVGFAWRGDDDGIVKAQSFLGEKRGKKLSRHDLA